MEVRKGLGTIGFSNSAFILLEVGFSIVWGCFSVFMWIKGLDRVTELCLNTLTTLRQK